MGNAPVLKHAVQEHCAQDKTARAQACPAFRWCSSLALVFKSSLLSMELSPHPCATKPCARLLLRAPGLAAKAPSRLLLLQRCPPCASYSRSACPIIFLLHVLLMVAFPFPVFGMSLCRCSTLWYVCLSCSCVCDLKVGGVCVLFPQPLTQKKNSGGGAG